MRPPRIAALAAIVLAFAACGSGHARKITSFAKPASKKPASVVSLASFAPAEPVQPAIAAAPAEEVAPAPIQEPASAPAAAAPESPEPVAQPEPPAASTSEAPKEEPAPVALVAVEPAAEEPAPAEPAAEQPAPEAPSYGLSGGWGGVRDYLGEHGFTLDFSVTFEMNSVLSGGVREQTSAHALYDLTGSFDLDRIAGWKDAQLTFEAYVIDGRNPSENVGDFQSFSDISADEVAQISQLFYEQWFGDHVWRLKLGKMDANSDFGAPANGTETIHSGAAYSPTCFTMVTYPNPATGILAGWVPNESWSLNVGMYDGAAMAGVNTGGLGPATFFGDPPGFFFIGEVGHRWKAGTSECVGGATIGAWRHTGDFANTSGGTTHNTAGFYGTLDQELSHAAEGESGGTKSVFLQLGFADEDVAPADRHLGAGFHWAGCCDSRPDDALGAYVSSVHFSDGAGFTASSETAYELDYACQCCNGVTLRPDLQYIVNPGGDSSLDDALVFSLRLELSF